MRAKRVHFWGLDEDGEEQTDLGSITWDGNTFTVQVGPDGTRLQMQNLLRFPIFLHNDDDTTLVYSKDDPEQFMDNLCNHYKSWALRASLAELVRGNQHVS